MDRFSQQISQIKDFIARPQIALTLLMAGMLPGVALFTSLGAQMMTSMLAGLSVSLLLLAALVPSIWAQRRAALISAALLAYACGTHIAIFRLALAAPHAALFDKLAGIILLSVGAFAAVAHSAWREAPRRKC